MNRSLAATALVAPLFLMACPSSTSQTTGGPGGAGGVGGTGGAGGPSPGDCQGQCIPVGPLGWTHDPVLLWIGDQTAAPPCPEVSKILAYEGFADLVAPSYACPTCTCGKPTCVLPAGIRAHSLQLCPLNNPADVITTFDAPAGWDGTCTAPPPVPASKYQSYAFRSSTVEDCAPITAPAPQPPPAASFKTFARACQTGAYPSCQDSDQVCSPRADPGDGFRQCVVYQKAFDENNPPECPNSHPEQHIFYGAYADTRACTACACSKPIGSDCRAAVEVFESTNCDPLSSLFGGTASLTNQPCMAYGLTGYDLMSMTAKWGLNEPGTCQPSGGELVGEVKPVDPTIFCCLPLSSP